MTLLEDDRPLHSPPTRLRPGTWLVLGMFALAAIMVGGLYGYLVLHHRPFRPLADAIAAEFPDSQPKVEGGTPRLDQVGDRVLRITMKTSPGPRVPDRASLRKDDWQTVARAEATADRVAKIAEQAIPLAEYDRVEIYLYGSRIEFGETRNRRRYCYPVRSGTVEPKSSSS